MNFLQAIAYFAREALLNLVRSWKVSLLAILTIAVSLFLAGVFLLVSGNLRTVVAQWEAESKIVVYLEPDVATAAREGLQRKIERAPWARETVSVTTETAHRRFRQAFPSMADLLEGWDDDPLPESLEISLDWDQARSSDHFEVWLAELHAEPTVTMVDDDRDWLGQLEAVILVIEGLGLVLGLVLLVTAIFTISSVIRLTAYLYRDEIAVMRMVGATEFFIRGPFYMEGLLQGLAGGGLAIVALLAVHALSLQRAADTLLISVLLTQPLRPVQLITLIGLGGLAGLIGSITSLKKESLGQTAETPEWSAE